MWQSVWDAGEGNRSIGSSGIMGSDQPRLAESWYLLAVRADLSARLTVTGRVLQLATLLGSIEPHLILLVSTT